MFIARMKHTICCGLMLVLALSLCIPSAAAKEASFNISGVIHSFDEDAHYELSSSTVSTDNSFGTLTLNGNMKESGTTNNIKTFIVNSGLFSISYTFNSSKLNVPSTSWHIVEDKTKSVNSYKLNDDILSGAILVQSSRDGSSWQTDKTITDVFTEDSVLKEPLFEANDIQLSNGCYYRILVAYKMEKQLDSSKVLFFNKENFEYKKIAEVYEFYACSGETSKATSPSDKPRKELGVTVKTELDKGYSGTETIDNKDPHFEMNLGTFVVNGYSRETSEDNVPVFLKNVGDNVTLWFVLDQDINRLNGKDELSISEDTNGYEIHQNPKLSIKQTNMKRGALIVRHTDNEGHTTVTPYFNFLEANARTTADTKILIREEGDYEISLLYEIEKCDVQLGSVKVVPSYTNYKINFTFKIRNSNTMVFPRDGSSGGELFDGEITTNGFRLDWAKSQYINVNVEHLMINVSKDGTITADTRWNRAAKEDTLYSDEGIYRITVKNLYSDGDPTEKTIYVGDNKYIKAMSLKKYSIDALNALIREGATVEEDGSITMPSTTIKPEPSNEEPQTSETVLPSDIIEPIEEPTNTTPVVPSEDTSIENESDTSNDTTSPSISPAIYGVIAVVVIGVIAAVIAVKKKSKPVSDEQ